LTDNEVRPADEFGTRTETESEPPIGAVAGTVRSPYVNVV